MRDARRLVFFDREPVVDFTGLVHFYERGEFASPYRSTIPLLSLLKEGEPAFATLLGALGVESLGSLHVEYKTAPARGIGRPSQTDLMVKAAGAAWAMEAKWTESRYETVAGRIDKDSDVVNRRKVVEGWLELIRPHVRQRLNVHLVAGVVYQMLHRAASACGAAARPALVYLVFHTEPAGGYLPKSFYRADLTQFHNLLGNPAGFPFYLVELELRPTAAFKAVEGLRKAVDSTAEQVRNALLGERLFDFGVPEVSTIGEG